MHLPDVTWIHCVQGRTLFSHGPLRSRLDYAIENALVIVMSARFDPEDVLIIPFCRRACNCRDDWRHSVGVDDSGFISFYFSFEGKLFMFGKLVETRRI